MNKKSNLKEASIMLIGLVDNVSTLNFLLEKADFLAGEVSHDYLSTINFKTEKGRLAAEYDLKIANVKASVAWDYIIQAKELTENLLNASNAALDFINQQK
ncbi:MAG: hypothetical protein IKB93_02540 [Clostridia bacterium]|nr:hypothetical protein [Clostridia bacterium]